MKYIMWERCKRYSEELSSFPRGSSDLAKAYEEERANALVSDMRTYTRVLVGILSVRLVFLSIFDASLVTMARITGLVAIIVLVQETLARIVTKLLQRRSARGIPALVNVITCICVSVLLVALFASRTYPTEALRAFSVQLVGTGFLFGITHVISDMRLFVPLLLLLEVSELFIPYPTASPASTLPISLTIKALYFSLCYVRERSQRQSFISRQEVQKQKQIYVEFVNNLPIPVVLFNSQGPFYLNEAAIQLGLTPTTSRDILQHLEARDGSSLDLLLDQMLNDPNIRVVHREFVLREVTQTKTYLVSAWASKGEEVTVAVTMIDITDTILLQEKKAAEKYTNMLLYSLSHELRTPLNGIKGMLKSVERNFPQVRKVCGTNLARAKASCVWLGSQINDMLDYVQLITNEFVVHPANVFLPSFLRKLKKYVLIELGTRTKTIRVVLDIAHNCPTYFQMDGNRLKQVCLNLLNVSTKTTTEGTIQLSVAYETQEAMLKITITDTSPGLPEPETERLFSLEPSSPDTRDPQRLGRGFAISRMICEKLGGGIDLQSKPGRGATAIVRIQAQPLQPERAEGELGDEGEERTSLSTTHIVPYAKACKSFYSLERSEASPGLCASNPVTGPEALVLVVDDAELNRFVLCEMLKNYPLQLKTASNGLESVQIITQELHLQPDRPILIFMDLQMPIMDGLAASRAIREIPATRPPIIVAATAYTAERERIACTEAGFNFFLTKPIHAAELKAALRLLHPSVLSAVA